MKKTWILGCFLISLANISAADQMSAWQRKPYLLSDSELAEMKEQIRQQCRLPKKDEGSYPWYYHYELGLALQHKNDWQRALDSFISALDRKEEPKKASRIYGMWFLDYYPYYNIGLSHYHLKNWKCAAESFRLSQTLEDISSNQKQFRSLLEYQTDVENHLKASEN
jgi:tetratricopeptide (TPR) repeat protein